MTATRRRAHLTNKERPWKYCDRCGKRTELGDLVKQDGYLVCVQRCVDDDTSLPRGDKRAEP
jgi:hypothetical protein